MSVKLLKKAEFGKPCTQCGSCCSTQVCELAMSVLPKEVLPCPFLGYDKNSNKLGCTLVEAEQKALPKHEWLTTKALAIGKGCGFADKI